ncbi:MAG: DNA2/NAM7 family helicase [Clostridia bacterium]|nr:DNA2/NAM7 family helicase [Clostridia bacterium]
MDILNQISKAIKEAKWLEITYQNKQNETTQYWIAIKDINPISRELVVDMFNSGKSMDSMQGIISCDRIKNAKVLNFSTYEGAEKLAEKIESNLADFQWMNYDHFNHNVLNYYAECNMLDGDPSQKDYSLIDGVDLLSLRKNKVYKLNDDQIEQIIKQIYHYDIKKTSNSFYSLVINCFSIDSGRNKFVIAYYNVSFDPKRKSLVLDRRVCFNKSFLIEGRRYSLFNYINMDVDKFIETFEKNYFEYLELIQDNLKCGEVVNTRPDMMILQRELTVNLVDTYSTIETKYENNNLTVPLKSFFGNISKRNNIRRKEPSIIIYDRKININQMRVLYNAMKYPVTYVQGPPGTGKTQTIINVVLSAFYNNKTMLICSSNNKPVDGIVEKLKFSYKGETINFPYLRLGNFEDVKKATLRILELYNYVMTTSKQSKADMLEKIKVTSDNKNEKLIELLNIQEKRVEIENYLDNAQKFVDSLADNQNKISKVLKKRVMELQEELERLPEISNEEVTSLFVPLQENYQLSQFLFFKSLQYIEKLKREKYKPLIDICSIKDQDERASEFNSWIQNDENMKMLSEAFPVIFSTNISSRRLGTAKFMFDLVIMDEAGQCNVATALIPISKANSLLLVGDPNQLKPVITLEDKTNSDLMDKYNVSDKYNYKKHSILDVMLENDNISKYILLKYHYRCGKKIIGFSNQRYYNNSLNLSSISRIGELELMNIKNKNVKQKNEAFEEANEIVKYIERNKLTDVFIVTPFVNQKELINNLLKSKGIDGIDCGTVHSAQGAEKGTIILSTALSTKTSKKTYEWLKNNQELINVAVTRAKNKLVIAVDDDVLNVLSADKKDDLYNLVEYIKKDGCVFVPPNESSTIEIGSSNGSQAEDEFYKTLSHFCSCHNTFEAERNVKLSKLFKGEKDFINSNKEFDLVLYEMSFFRKKPAIVFEINGGEHFGTLNREQSDRAKMEICKKMGIKIVFIPNSFVKNYEYIVDIIMSSKNAEIPIQQSLFDSV